MARKILYGALIAISSILLVLSVMGVGAAWVYNEPLTQQGEARLTEIDRELGQAQSALGNASTELSRALRIIEGAETALAALSQTGAKAQQALQGIGEALDGRLIPGLKTASEKIDQVRVTLQGVLTTLKTINSVPFLNVAIPGEELLTGLIEAADTLDAEIASVEVVADQASTVLGDVDYLLGGDLTETKQSVEQLLAVVNEYGAKLDGWRTQIAQIQAGLAGWIDQACIALTIFLLWFALSQFGLILIGLQGWQGGNPLTVLRPRAGTPA
jgi:hypothetical protein